ncbi:hypothetical protein FHR81_003103 [Actinoalloteichus hoggarensis]|uniref:Uncharacterized protein n=1 Tax=Actinoalloteichus hoggarensis TaxID=1470176 RepID=A0A221W684_9PSEU|nr:hypothetical protein [Actinoalloteichus hoggarensis]ASO21462.1 hypothetical protein AHOG_19200 [Actinoalloteichus hoggarensis]MBB5922051.1 hypothetical protein [Actinoalloteichus hoggarensis]
MTGFGEPNRDVDFFGMLDDATAAEPEPASPAVSDYPGQPVLTTPPTGSDGSSAADSDRQSSTPHTAPAPVEPAASRPAEATHHSEPPGRVGFVGVAGDGNATAGGNLDQSQHFHVYGPDSQPAEIARPRNRTRSGRWDPEALASLADRFVAPAGLLDASDQPSAFEILADWRLVLLSAQVKSGGQFTAALRLAQRLRETENARLIVRQEILDRGFRLDAGLILDADTPAVVILDLREGSAEDVHEVRNNLVEFGDQLKPHRSFLVVILPVEQRRPFEERFPGRVHLLSRPSGALVFDRHVELVEDSHTLSTEAGLLERLDQAWPPEAKEIAEAVSEARRAGYTSPEDIAARLADPTDVLAEELRKAITELQSKDDKEAVGLLLACGLFEGAAADRILTASDQMLTVLKTQVREPDPLLRPGVTATLHRLGTKLFDPRTRTFTTPRLGSSVLTYFWKEHPMLRSPVQEWLQRLPVEIEDLGQAELERLADRAADLAAEAGVELITALAQGWAAGQQTTILDRRQDQTRRSIAVRLLTRTAVDPNLGRAVRERLWDWSRSSSPDVQLLVAIVCGEIGSDFPRVALTRIKHLATAAEPLVRRHATDAMVRIGRESGLPTFLRYVEGWLDRPSADRMELLAESIERLLDADPHTITGEGVREFWSRALGEMSLLPSRRIVGAWLRYGARSTTSVGRDAVETLVAATERDPHRIARLQWASRVAGIPLDPGFVEEDPINAIIQQVWTRLDEIDPVHV